MTREKLDERLTALEQEVGRLKVEVDKLRQPKDWRSALGMFTGNEEMKRIDEEGRKIREADRQRARKAAAKAKGKTKQKAVKS